MAPGATGLAVPYPTNVPEFDPVERGLALEEQGKTTEARKAFREAIEANSGSVAARILLARSLAASKTLEDLKEAMSELATALSMRPDHAEGWRLAANAASKMLFKREASDESGNDNDSAAADELLKHFIACLSPVPGLSDEKPNVVEKLRYALEKDPDSPDVNTLLFDAVKAFYRRSLALEPGSIETFSAVTSFMLSLSAPTPTARASYAEAALEAALNAVKAAPYDYRALLLAGRAYQHRADTVEVDSETQEGLEEKMSFLASAEESYRQALLLGPASTVVINNLARVFADQDKTDEGVEYFQKLGEATDKEGVRLLTMHSIAYLYSASGQTDKAEEQWFKVAEAYPARLDAYLRLVTIYLGEEQTDKAVELLTDVAKEHPTFLNAHELLGRLHMEAGRVEKAEEHFLAAIRLHDAGFFESAESDDEQEQPAGIMKLFHSALMNLSNIYISRHQYLKAGDIIDNYKSVYFRTNPRGNLIADSAGHPIPREPADVPAEAMLQAGGAYYRAHRRSKARQCLIEAARMKQGNYYVVQLALAQAYQVLLQLNVRPEEKLKAAENARRVWEKVLEEVAGDPKALHQLAQLTFEISKRSAAEIEALARNNPNETRAAGAVNMLNDMLKEHPNNISVLLLRANIHEFLGDPEEALEDTKTLLAVKPDDAVAPAMGKVQPVAEEVLNTLRARALALAAWIHAQASDDLDEAEELAKKALEATPPSPAVLDTLDYIGYLTAVGRIHDALAWVAYRRAMAHEDAAARTETLLSARRSAKLAMAWQPTPTSRYHYAEIILALNSDSKSHKDAITQLEKALSDTWIFREADRAAALLKKLKSQ